ncbi:histone-like nucleoid-structuring protein Lsr2 [Nocardia transvalensis]|uniref:histone-like nucleoid-structuring protein Lsr2 n=1 Tax=Nocardia transvalensis TaxID=37333 RepID=UPI0018953F3E|nr:Lsr2 family protein [Nocardia transvalensis]MBF6332469.1 Lsr2 family protein [Nocardia transvalensis]
MARKVVVELVDDFDGVSPAEETVSFALDGIEYEIDLSVLNAGKLRETFDPWTKHGRKVSRGPRPRTSTRQAPKSDKTAVIRAWARKNGFRVSARGRVQATVVAAYEKAIA